MNNFLQYSIIRELGRGAKGVVYLVEKDGARYALKKLLKDESSAYLDSVLRFRQELQALSNLQHPGIVGVIEAGEVDGEPFLIMEHLDGQSLDKYVGRALPKDQVVDIAIQIAEALQEIHRKKMIHRDIKPENIVLTSDGRTKILDFGMVTVVGQDSLSRGGDTSSSQPVVGTLIYSAPEQCGLLPLSVGEGADLYSLGAIMYELLTGENPFAGSDPGLLLQVKTKPLPESVKECSEGKPTALGEIIFKLLEPDPARRYQSAHGLIADLRKLPELEESLRQGKPCVLGAADRGLRLLESPLVGRSEEFEALKAIWTRAKQSSGGTAFIQGDSGVGKSRLANEALQLVNAEGGEVLSVRCTRVGGVAMAPVLDLLKLYFNNLLAQPQEKRQSLFDGLLSLPEKTLGILAGSSDEIADVLGESVVPEAGTDVAQEVWVQHLIDVFKFISSSKNGLYLLVEEVHWMDEASLEFFKRLSREASHAAIMLVMTGYSDADMPEEMRIALGSLDWPRIQLIPLPLKDTQKMISGWLGGADIEIPTVEKIAAPTNFNPMAMREYLTGMIDAAVFHLESGHARIDEKRLREVGLSVDAFRLLQERVKKLDEDSRRILSMAAIFGLRFSENEIATVLGEDPKLVARIVRDAIQENLLMVAGTGESAFTHEKVKDAFLSLYSVSELKDAHDRAAAYLESVARKSPEQMHALAIHYMEGHVQTNIPLAMTAFEHAGRLALKNYSNQMAYAILKFADDLVRVEKLDPARFFDCLELFGAAAHNTSRYDEAGEVFESLMPYAKDRLTQSRLLFWQMKTENGRGRLKEAWEYFLKSMKALGRPYPVSPVMKVLVLLRNVILNFYFLYRPKAALRRAKRTRQNEEVYQKILLLNKILEVATKVCFVSFKQLDLVCLGFMANNYSSCLGRTRERVMTESLMSILWATLHRTKLADHYINSANEIAQELNDEGLQAQVGFNYCLSRMILNQIPVYIEFFNGFIGKAEKFLPYWELGSVLTAHSAIVGQLGWLQELVEFHFNKMYLVDETKNLGMMADFRRTYAARLDLLGRTEQAEQLRAEANTYFEQIKDSNDMSDRLNMGIRLYLGAEGAKDPEINQAIDTFLSTGSKGFFVAVVHVWIVQIRFMQFRRAGSEQEKAMCLKSYRKSLKRLKKNITTDLLNTIYLSSKASLLRIEGKFDRADALILRAERLAERSGSDNGIYAALVERARLSRDRGFQTRFAIELRAAAEYAREREWKMRLDLLEEEFGPFPKEETAEPSSLAAPAGETAAGGLDRERAMHALLEISAAASKSIDPVEQSRSTLDTVVHLLGAERACIFLGSDSDSLKFFLGRTAQTDMEQIHGFSTTVVKKVFDERKPIIITGTEQGEAIGSKSIVAHNLKSIIVVPLILAEHIKGVIYLDSSITKGLFSEDDLDLCRAISTQIASSIHFAELAAAENERLMLKRDIEVSASVQTLFLPDVTDLDFDEVSLSAFYRPAAQCSGDWWWYKSQHDKLYIMVGDVGGHGVGPAMITASVASGYKIWEKNNEIKVGELIKATNRHLYEIARGEHFMTMFGCEIDRGTKLVRYWSAGAPLVLVQNKHSAKMSYIGAPGNLLGADADKLELGQGEYQAESGDRLFIYSDGLSEMCDAHGRVLGDRRLGSMFATLKDVDLHEVKHRLVERLDELRGEEPQDDDFTFVIVDIA